MRIRKSPAGRVSVLNNQLKQVNLRFLSNYSFKHSDPSGISQYIYLLLLSVLIFTGVIGTANAGLPKCYGVSDSSAKMWFMVPDPGASPLSGAQQISLPIAHRAEGSAYRPSNQKMYLFDCAGDNIGPCDLREYTIDVAAGTTSHTVLKTDMIRHPDGTADNGRSVEGATFFIDDINEQEYLFATAGERDSTTHANSGRLYKYNTTTWDLEPGYPLEIRGDVGSITALAYDPISDKYYGAQDYASSDGSSNNADIYEIDLATGVTIFSQEMSLATDSEGLTYAADGLLYTEEDQGASGKGRKILTVDISDGSMVLAASFDGTSGDAESLACNAGEKTDMGDLPSSYGYAAHTLPVFSLTPNPMYLGVIPGDDDFGTANNDSAGNGDDLDDANDDEDGVTFSGQTISDMAVLQGSIYGLDIVTNGNGYLSAWFDWNNDGDFEDAGEQVAADLDGSSGTISLNVTIPATTADGVLYSRFRYSSDTGLGPNDDVSNGHWAADGEAEDYRLFVNPQMNVVKTSTPDNTPVQPGDVISYKMSVSNPSSLIILHDIAVTDPVPQGTTYVPGSANVTFWDIESGTYIDNVSTHQQYNESYGTLDWSTSPWQEINDGGSPTGGDIQILVDPAIGGVYSIRVKDTNKGVQRTANLSAYAAATLSLDYRRDDRNNSNGSVAIEVSSDGVNWDPVPLATITVDGDDASYIHLEYDISNKISATTTIRFLSDGLLHNDDRVFFDNIQITGMNRKQKTVPAHDPANLTLASDGYSIYPNDNLTVVFDVIVGNPVSASISNIENTVSVTAREIVKPKTSRVQDPLTVSSIGDLIWSDQNGDGVQDGGEQGLSGVTVFLDLNSNGTLDAGEPNDISDANGAYDFTGLSAGTYSVQVDNSTVPSAYILSTGSDPVSVTLTAGQDYNMADFGYQQQNASIGDRLWNDLDGDGIQDGGESGLSGVTIFLDLNSNGTLDAGEPSDTTVANGAYDFTGLSAGSYSVQVDNSTMPSAYTLTAGTDPLSVTLTAGQDYNNADFGYQQQNTTLGSFPGGGAKPIPTLSEWMLILMSMMLALTGWNRAYRQGDGGKM